MSQPSLTTGRPAPTTPGNDMDEALRRVQGRPAPTAKPRAEKAVA
ncbi:hypothetical protein AB0G98_21685 [Streptomyces sp. NPDC020196]